MKLEFNTLDSYMHAVTFCIKHGLTFEGEESDVSYTLTLTGGF